MWPARVLHPSPASIHPVSYRFVSEKVWCFHLQLSSGSKAINQLAVALVMSLALLFLSFKVSNNSGIP